MAACMEVCSSRDTTSSATCVENQAHGASHNRINTTVQELCESRGGRPGLSVLTSLMVSVDVNGKAILNHAHALVSK